MLKLPDLAPMEFSADNKANKKIILQSKATGITVTIEGNHDYLQGVRETTPFKALLVKDNDQPDFESFLFN